MITIPWLLWRAYFFAMCYTKFVSIWYNIQAWPGNVVSVSYISAHSLSSFIFANQMLWIFCHAPACHVQNLKWQILILMLRCRRTLALPNLLATHILVEPSPLMTSRAAVWQKKSCPRQFLLWGAISCTQDFAHASTARRNLRLQVFSSFCRRKVASSSSSPVSLCSTPGLF